MLNALDLELKHRRAILLLLAFSVLAILVVVQTLLSARDVVDEWILSGVWPVFIVFMLTYCVTVASLDNLKTVAIVTSVFLAICNLIPSLKYDFLYGFFDPLGHYAFLSEVIRTAHVPTIAVGFYTSQYGSTPGMHLVVAGLSIVTGLDVVSAMKLFLILLPVPIPLAVYYVTRKVDIAPPLSKLCVVAVAIVEPTTYIFTGTASIYPLYVLLTCLIMIIMLANHNHRSEFVVALVVSGAIVVSHDFTSFFLLGYMLIALIVSAFVKLTQIGWFKVQSRFPIAFGLLFCTISLGHFVFSSQTNMMNLLSQIKELLLSLVSAKGPEAITYYGSFYQLTVLDKIKVLVVRLSKDAILVLSIVTAILIALRMRRTQRRTHLIYKAMAIPALIAGLTFALPLAIHPLIDRGFYYLGAFSPFLLGLSLYYLFHIRFRRIRSLVLSIAIFALLVVSSVQTYSFQPGVPTVTVGGKAYYVGDWRQVNTIYDRSVISFVAKYDKSIRFSTDGIMNWQILIEVNPAFWALSDWNREINYERPLTLISESGPAHTVPSWKNAWTNDQFLHKALNVSDVIYSSGYSYALLNYTIMP